MERKRILWIAIGTVCILSGIAAVVGYSLNIKRQPERLTLAAQQSIERGNLEEASLMARRALQINPDYLPACNTMASICDRLGVPDALQWRKRAADLAGGSADALIAFALTAIRCDRDDLAQSALNRVSENERNREDFQAASGAIALNAGKYAEAEAFYAAACRLAPANDTYRFGLAKAQAASEDFLTRESGRSQLRAMISESKFALPASRALILSYESTAEIQAAARESRALIQLPGHTFTDELLHLRFLRMTGDEGFAAALATAQAKATKDEQEASLMIQWMHLEGLAAEAIKWATKKLPNLAELRAVRPPLARCYLTMENWSALLDITQEGPWDPIDHIRHAFRAKALRESGNLLLARSEWSMAVAAAATPEAVSWLMKTSEDWNWPEQVEQSLWAAVDKPTLARQALTKLYRLYESKSDTAGMRKVSARLIEIDPSNEDAQNNFAMFSLLKDRDQNLATELARSLYQKHPKDASYVSTHAFALYRLGRSDEAQRVLETLPPADLEKPAVAAYYGLVLAANHHREKAMHFFEIARSAPLLDEERQMLEKAVETASREKTPKPPKP